MGKHVSIGKFKDEKFLTFSKNKVRKSEADGNIRDKKYLRIISKQVCNNIYAHHNSRPSNSQMS